MTKASRTIGRDEARALVAEMLFGTDWIPGITKEQSALLNADFGPKCQPVFQAGVMVNTINVFERPCPAERRQEFDIAIGRHVRMLIQGMTVDDWIQTVAKLDPTKGILDRGALITAMQRHQQDSETASAARRGPKALKMANTAAAMKADIEAGKFTLADLGSWTQDAVATNYSVSRETARNARAMVLSEFQPAEASGNSDKTPTKRARNSCK